MQGLVNNASLPVNEASIPTEPERSPKQAGLVHFTARSSTSVAIIFSTKIASPTPTGRLFFQIQQVLSRWSRLKQLGRMHVSAAASQQTKAVSIGNRETRRGRKWQTAGVGMHLPRWFRVEREGSVQVDCTMSWTLVSI
jgi:hypothetical protein